MVDDPKINYSNDIPVMVIVLQSFFLFYSELRSWVSDIRALVVADELAKDVAGAEAIIQRHKERKEEIDAQDDSFKASSQFGQNLISSGHYESEQVKEIVRCDNCRAP